MNYKCPNPACGFEGAEIFLMLFEFAVGWCPKCGTLVRFLRNKNGVLASTGQRIPNPKASTLVIAKPGTKIHKQGG